MKKRGIFLLVLCLAVCCFFSAFADGAPKFKKHLASQTTDKKGSVTFSFQAVDFDSGLSSWHFVDPVTGVDRTGPELREFLSDAKGFAVIVSGSKQHLTMTKVPDALHGWLVYVKLSNKSGYTVTSEKVRLSCLSVLEASVPGEGAGMSDGTVTIRAEGLSVCPLDAGGNPDADKLSSVWTAAPPVSVLVLSDRPLASWTVNGVRFQPFESVSGFILENITENLAVTAD